MLSFRYLFVLLLTLGSVAQAESTHHYTLDYVVEMRPADGIASVTMKLAGERLPSRLVLKIDPERHRNFRASSGLEVDSEEVHWQPRGTKAELHYEFVVNHRRGNSGYDSFMNADWAIFRGDRLVPRIYATAPPDLHSQATLRFVLPSQWSVVTALASTDSTSLAFDDPNRRFDRPRGWMLAGKLGKRSQKIAGVVATVAAPVEQDVRRQDMLAFLSWNLPHLIKVFPRFPERITIISAGDPMWRGGLSGPASLFIHADRPLISENRTSTLLHELVHVAMGIRGAPDSDWIVEGLAEYYSLETLRRSNGISDERYEEAMKKLERWARKAPSLRVPRSSGAVTAKAVILFKQADTEIRKLTRNKRSLDDVAARIAEQRSKPVTLEMLQTTAREVAGRDLETFAKVH
jgi:predicted metalloprotease with PDZ domain